MGDFLDSFSIAASGMRAQAKRLRHVAENIANADTPGYRRKSIPFHAAAADSRGEVRTGRVQLDPAELSLIHDPTHPMADGTGHYQGSNVNSILEIADSREAQRSYEANLKMFDQTRKMSGALLDLLRR
ncbi:flagellar basal body rod protein FlgC [Fluviibacterium sp. DFM31]|uniref:Flagellar basal body rod protein FlgC n=1 Tax=Meridianimarinicoccus marinus TaxID=3231483 RepID=A0ABV3L316_9RHOB